MPPFVVRLRMSLREQINGLLSVINFSFLEAIARG